MVPKVRAKLRERTTLDLRGLGPAMRAHAKARNMTVSSIARMAVVKLLESTGSVLAASADPEPLRGVPAVKMTLRLMPRTAQQIATRARAAGLSHGAYVTAVIEGAPVAMDHNIALAALAESTDRLASVAADLKQIGRRLHDTSPSDHVEDAVVAAVRDLQAHLHLAARLVADLKPIAAWRRDASQRLGGSRRSHP